MVTKSFLVRFEAKPGKEAELGEFLTKAVALANQEPATTAWFALRFGPSTFGVFDAFPDEAGRAAHLVGPIATALRAQGPGFLAGPPSIERLDILGAKLP